jgi:hypothetical protein
MKLNVRGLRFSRSRVGQRTSGLYRRVVWTAALPRNPKPSLMVRLEIKNHYAGEGHQQIGRKSGVTVVRSHPNVFTHKNDEWANPVNLPNEMAIFFPFNLAIHVTQFCYEFSLSPTLLP